MTCVGMSVRSQSLINQINMILLAGLFRLRDNSKTDNLRCDSIENFVEIRLDIVHQLGL